MQYFYRVNSFVIAKKLDFLLNLPNSILSFAFLFNIFNNKSLSSGEVSFGILFKKRKKKCTGIIYSKKEPTKNSNLSCEKYFKFLASVQLTMFSFCAVCIMYHTYRSLRGDEQIFSVTYFGLSSACFS